jgi:NAD(P)H-hydrate epimerase
MHITKPTAALTRAQLREIDLRAIQEYGIPGIVLMENAAIHAVKSACDMLKDRPKPRVLILCGGGNNGGDGLAIARHLHNHRIAFTLALTVDPSRYTGDALINWRVIQSMKIATEPATRQLVATAQWDLIVDAIFGTGLLEPPREPFPALADAVNSSGRPVLAIDVPSGLDCDTGVPPGACIIATRTVTFVALKAGFANPLAARYLGEVVVGDIGCPIELIDAVRNAASM